MLGFMMRICANFNADSALISLYFAYVRSHLEYAAIVLSPNYDVYLNRIESVQKKFFSFVFKKFGYYSIIKLAPYLFKCSLLNIEQFSDRSNNSKLLFIFDPLTGRIDSSKILSLLDINVPVRQLRNHSFFRLNMCRTNYAALEPVFSMMSLFNDMYYLFEFEQSRDIFKKKIRRIFFQRLSESVE